MPPTHHHRLILPADSNHHGTLYAGSLLRLALEAGYATAWRHAGTDANLVLRRVLNLECLRPVPVGTVIVKERLMTADSTAPELLTVMRKREPGYNANNFSNVNPSLETNHAVSDVYEPGSVFKVVTLSAALETTNLRPDSPINCNNGVLRLPGRVIHEAHHGFGVIPI